VTGRSAKLSTLLPNLFKIPRPVIDAKSPIIVSGNLLQLGEVHMLPIVQGLEPRIDQETKIKMYAALGGASILNKLLNTPPRDYGKLIWTPCEQMPVWIGTVNYDDSLEDLLTVFVKTRFGNAAVERSAPMRELVTLSEILGLYRTNVIASNLRAEDVGSEMISISSDQDLLEAVRLMFRKKVRRVFLKSSTYRNSNLEYISDRDIIRFLFSPDRLEIVKKSPELWVKAKLSDLDSNMAKSISDGKTINQASLEIGDKIADCLVCNESLKVVTRWDVVVKPFVKGHYELSTDI
jgi:CBS domain-containing protein